LEIISWGIKNLDKTIGMIEPRIITLFYGLTGSGKTTLSTYIPIVRIVKSKKLRENDVFIVVDTDGGFDLPRFEEIIKNNNLDSDVILDHLLYYDVTDFSEQHDIITDTIPYQLSNKNLRPLLISVDPITSLYRGIILRTDPKYKLSTIGIYTGKIDLQMVTLRRLAVKYECPVFVSTWPSSQAGASLTSDNSPPPEQPFIGGRQMGFLPKIIAEIIKPQDKKSPIRTIKLFKARNLPTGLECKIKLSPKGIEPV